MTGTSKALLAAGLAGLGTAVIAGLMQWYEPVVVANTVTGQARVLAASETAENLGRKAMLSSLRVENGEDTIETALSTRDVHLTLGHPRLRIVEGDPDLLVLSVEIEEIVNNSGYDFDIVDPCAAQAEGGRVAAPAAFLSVSAVNSARGLVATEPSGFYPATWATDAGGEEIYFDQTGELAARSLDAHTLVQATCEAGNHKNALEDLSTNLANGSIKSLQTVSLSAQNTLEFVLPLAPDYVFEEGLLVDSAYPYFFGGVFVVDRDYEVVGYGKLR